MSEDASGRAKVACSIKLVDQKAGADLDPSGVKWQPRGEGGGGGGGYSRAPIQADVKVADGARRCICSHVLVLLLWKHAYPEMLHETCSRHLMTPCGTLKACMCAHGRGHYTYIRNWRPFRTLHVNETLRCL